MAAGSPPSLLLPPLLQSRGAADLTADLTLRLLPPVVLHPTLLRNAPLQLHVLQILVLPVTKALVLLLDPRPDDAVIVAQADLVAPFRQSQG